MSWNQSSLKGGGHADQEATPPENNLKWANLQQGEDLCAVTEEGRNGQYKAQTSLMTRDTLMHNIRLTVRYANKD